METISVIEKYIEGLVLKPGIVVYFRDRSGLLDQQQDHFVKSMKMRSTRHGLSFDIVDAPDPRLAGFTVSRLFNVGNLHGNACVYIRPDAGVDIQLASQENFFDRLIDFDNWTEGSVDATVNFLFDASDDFLTHSRSYSCPKSFDFPDENDDRDIQAEFSTLKSRSISIANRLSFDSEFESVDEESDIDLSDIEAERRESLRRIGMVVMEYVRRYHEMPPVEELFGEISGKFLIGSEHSPVVVNGNLEIVLPDYDEMKLKLTPLCRAIYILFLLHPEGIVLKEIGDCHRQLTDIYYLVKPNADPERTRLSVDDICSPCSESLLQKISMIKRNVRSQLVNPALADYYSISGERGRAYCLPAARGRLKIPAALK